MRRLVWIVLVVVGLAVLLPASALAAANDIPGTPMTLGQTVSDTIDSTTKPNDVYAIHLDYGHQVELSCAQLSPGSYFTVNLLAPTSQSVSGTYQSLAYTDTANNNGTYGTGQFFYTPAVSGTYYVWAQAQGPGMTYQLSMAATGVTVAGPQLPDIFGVPVGVGTISGVVDKTTCPNAVYAVRLFAGEAASISCQQLSPDSYVSMSLLSPNSHSVNGTYQSLEYADTANNIDTYGFGQISYTPAVTGTYFVWLQGQGNGITYDMSVSGSAQQPLYPDHLWLRTSSAHVRKGGHVILSGSLNAALVNQGAPLIGGQTISLLRSYDNKHWKTITTIKATSGNYSLHERITRRTWFRAAFGSHSGYASCISKKIVVAVK